MNLQTAILTRIYDLCEERNISPLRMCLNAHISPNLLYELKNKDHCNTRISTIACLCSALGNL